MTEHSDKQASRLKEYQKRLEELMAAAREGIDRQAPEVLEKLAATASDIARRLEDMARDARQRAAGQEAAATSAAPDSQPPEEPHPDEPRGDGEKLP